MDGLSAAAWLIEKVIRLCDAREITLLFHPKHIQGEGLDRTGGDLSKETEAALRPYLEILQREGWIKYEIESVQSTRASSEERRVLLIELTEQYRTKAKAIWGFIEHVEY